MSLQPHSWAYTGENMVPRDVCPQVFTAALLTEAKTQEQSKCPATEG